MKRNENADFILVFIFYFLFGFLCFFFFSCYIFIWKLLQGQRGLCFWTGAKVVVIKVLASSC